MPDKYQVQIEDRQWPEGWVFDDVQDMYIGPIGEVYGMILAESGPVEAIFRGEVLVYGQSQGGKLEVDRLRRLALYGASSEMPNPGDPIGVLSLVGPLDLPSLQPGMSGSAQVSLQLHYHALSELLEAQYESEDAVLPQVERMTGALSWSQEDGADEPTLLVELKADLVESKLGLIRQIVLNPMRIAFRLAGSEQSKPASDDSLPDRCAAPPAAACPPALATVERRLPIKFVNFSTKAEADVETACRNQIAGVCEAWRNRGALDLTIQVDIDQGTPRQKANFAQIDITQEAGLENEGFAVASQVEVYLVDELLNRPGGGITHKQGQASAFCILGLDQLNPYLLAHELAHVLPLEHPDSPIAVNPGSWGSVAEPSGAAGANPKEGTLYNFRVFTGVLGGLPLNPIVVTTAVADCYHPDPVDHYVRDFPSDTGVEPSMPSPGEDYWSNSGVWNRHAASPDGLNALGEVEHQEPLCTALQSYMYVKLEHRTILRDPAYVDLYLADPGIGPGTANLISLSSAGNHIEYNPPPAPGVPVTGVLQWSWTDVVTRNPGFPRHCCVFAIAYSMDEPSPFATPTGVTFADVVAVRGTNNDIVQRNLSIQGCAAPAGAAYWTILPWVQAANPFPKPASVRLEVDTHLAPDLEGMILEVDEMIWGEVKVGDRIGIVLHDALPPEESMILRLRTTLPADAVLGTVFPVNLSFFIDDRLVSGYRHEIRVVPVIQLAAQTLDKLFGALHAVSVVAKSGEALLVAKTVAKTRARYTSGGQQEIEPVLGSLQRLARRVAILAQSIEPQIAEKQELRAIHRRLLELSGILLLSHRNQKPALFLEHLRDLADRIQETARRTARSV